MDTEKTWSPLGARFEMQRDDLSGQVQIQISKGGNAIQNMQ